jgi:hypothetical protein
MPSDRLSVRTAEPEFVVISAQQVSALVTWKTMTILHEVGSHAQRETEAIVTTKITVVVLAGTVRRNMTMKEMTLLFIVTRSQRSSRMTTTRMKVSLQVPRGEPPMTMRTMMKRLFLATEPNGDALLTKTKTMSKLRAIVTLKM